MGKRNSRTVDKYYQHFYGFVQTASAGTALARQEIQLPTIPSQYIGSGKSVIYELLWAEMLMNLPEVIAANHTHEHFFGMMLMDRDDINDIVVADANTMFQFGFQRKYDHTTSGTSEIWIPYSYKHDFQDMKGNGRLIARDTVYLYIYHDNSAGGVMVTSMDIKVAYRLVTVPLQEYIGLLGEQSYR